MAAQLYALVDGLALHGTLWPQRYPPAHLRATLDAYLASVTGPGSGGEPS